ncbi:MAG: hypothetical protein GF401_09355 [Chitinivibrionales bacterium]|nr:hypothetical protein [Chitinivibrionales bacterium]
MSDNSRFYTKGEASPAVAPAAGKKVDKNKDPVTEKEWKKAPVKPGQIPENKEVSIKLIKPEKTPHKQFVNLKQNDSDQGPELTMSV